MSLKFYMLILYFPLVSFLACCGLGFFIGHNGSVILSTFLIFITFLLSVCGFFAVINDLAWYVTLGCWFQIDILLVNYGFIFDVLSVTMSCVVSFISFLVHLYSTNYMRLDPSRSRFMGYLSMFTFFMMLLIFSDNFVLFFFGWEGIGLSSYLLIGFWFTRIQANKSALKALLVNRVGDFFLLLGIVYVYLLFGSVDFLVVFSLVPFYTKSVISFFGYNVDFIFVISLLLFFAAVGKSAQIFLHTWLPDAMEGPTPVSALIHAATMVTAGVFLILRASFIFQYASPAINQILIWFGVGTIFLSSIIGCVQYDIKKIIAYSTCSQLGYMVLACGLSEYAIAFYHLVNHAFFKALLFLAAGSVIHSLCNEQDIRKMGGLLNVLPLTYSVFIVGSFALSGFPFLSGFFSKDPLILSLFCFARMENLFLYWIVIFSSVLTGAYSCRLIYFVFLAFPSGYEKIYKAVVEDSSLPVLVPFTSLAILSIFSGFYLEELFIGPGSYVFDFCLKVTPVNSGVDNEFLVPWFIKLIPLILSFSSLFFLHIGDNKSTNDSILLPELSLTSATSSKKYFSQWEEEARIIFLTPQKRNFGAEVYRMFREKAHFNFFYNMGFARNFLKTYPLVFKVIDTNFLEIFGPFSIARVLRKAAFAIFRSEKTFFSFYFNIFAISALHFIFVFLLLT